MSDWSRIREHQVLQWTLGYATAANTLLHGVKMVGSALDIQSAHDALQGV